MRQKVCLGRSMSSASYDLSKSLGGICSVVLTGEKNGCMMA